MGRKKKPSCSAWVDGLHRVVSFLPQEGFQEQKFPTHQEMFAFVISLGHSGFGIL